jgi:hypothetical protein
MWWLGLQTSTMFNDNIWTKIHVHITMYANTSINVQLELPFYATRIVLVVYVTLLFAYSPYTFN